MEKVEQVKDKNKDIDNEHNELKAKYDELLSDVKQIIAPLNTVKNLLPASVKAFVDKHKGK